MFVKILDRQEKKRLERELEKDKEATFIKKWLPELENLPNHLAHEPWKITPLEEAMYGIKYGEDYPKRVVDIQETGKFARDKLWATLKSDQAKKESRIVLKKFTSRKYSIIKKNQ